MAVLIEEPLAIVRIFDNQQFAWPEDLERLLERQGLLFSIRDGCTAMECHPGQSIPLTAMSCQSIVLHNTESVPSDAILLELITFQADWKEVGFLGGSAESQGPEVVECYMLRHTVDFPSSQQ